MRVPDRLVSPRRKRAAPTTGDLGRAAGDLSQCVFVANPLRVPAGTLTVPGAIRRKPRGCDRHLLQGATMRIRSLTAHFFWAAGLTIGADSSVCMLLSSHPSSNGQMVTLQAPVSNPPFGLVAVGEECTSHIVASGHQFPDVISIRPSSIYHRLTRLEVRFDGTADFRRLDKLQIEAKGKHLQLVCEIEGLFESRPVEQLWYEPAGTPQGFGHLNAAPAQLTLKK